MRLAVVCLSSLAVLVFARSQRPALAPLSRTVGRRDEHRRDHHAGVVGVEEALRRVRHERRDGSAERVARHGHVAQARPRQHLALQGGAHVRPHHVKHGGEAGCIVSIVFCVWRFVCGAWACERRCACVRALLEVEADSRGVQLALKQAAVKQSSSQAPPSHHHRQRNHRTVRLALEVVVLEVGPREQRVRDAVVLEVCGVVVGGGVGVHVVVCECAWGWGKVSAAV